MSVEVGSLSYVSTLDNSDFQAKSQQDIKLITARLQLTGDTSGIEKYDAAFKAATAAELQIQKDLNDILDQARVKTQALADTIQTPATRTIFSDSVAEVAAYNDALVVFGDTGNVALSGVDELLKQLNLDLEKGVISAEEYNTAILAMDEAQQRFQQQATASTVRIQQEVGIIEELKIAIADLNRQKLTANIDALPGINAQLQQAEVSLSQFNNIGKHGFDEFGNQLDNVVPKAGKFEAAISRVTNVQNVAGRVVTQFSRQIIGLATGFLSLEIGAKAIQSLIEYVENLDVFTGKLDEAVQAMAAFNEINKNANQAIGQQIAPLKELYDAATNVNLAMNERLAAAKALKDADAANFQGASDLAIINGELKGSFDELTSSIEAQARAQAGLNKIIALEAQIQDDQFTIAKNNASKSQELQRINGNSFSGSSGTGGGGGQVLTPQQQAANIKRRTDVENAEPTQDIKTAQQTIDFIEKLVGNVNKSAKNLSDANKLLGPNLENFNHLISTFEDKQQLDNIQSALQTKLNQLGVSPDQQSQIRAALQKVADLEKQYQVKATKTAGSDPAIALLASQTTLLQNIDALKSKYATKDKTRNEQAQDELIASFQKEYNAIVAQNVKVNAYIKAHGQAAATAKGLQIIDPTTLQDSEQNALAGLAGQQSVDDTKNQIGQQKALFTEYEAFKLQAGTEAADKLFGNELQGYKTYLDFLRAQQPSEADLTSADPFTKARASALSDYLKVEIPKANDEEIKLNQKHIQDLIIQDQDYNQQRAQVIAKGNEDIATLQKAGDADGAAQAARNQQDKLTALDEANFKTLQLYKDLFDDITNLTSKQAADDIASLETKALNDLQAGKLTTEAYAAIIKQLDTASKALKASGVPQTLSEIGSALSTLGSDISKTNSNLGSIVTSLGSSFSSISKLMNLQSEISNANTKDSVKLQDQIQVYTIAAQGIIGIINGITEASAKRQQQETEYYDNIIAFQEQYNLALIQQQQIQFQTQGNIFETDFAQELSDGALAYTKATAAYKTALGNLTQGQAIVGQKNVINGGATAQSTVSGIAAGAAIGSIIPGIGSVAGAVIGGIGGLISGLFGTKTKQNVLAPLLQQFPALISSTGDFNEALAKSLIATNQVTDATKVLLQNTIDYYDQAQSAITQINSALTSLSDNLASSLDDALVTAFENGTDAAKAFGDTVSNVIGNIIQQFLFQDIFNSQFDALNAKLKATVLGGGTTGDITKDFLDFFKDAGPLVQQFEDGLKAAQAAGATQGINLFPPTGTSSPTTLSGQIQASVTEATADILAGTLKGIQLNTFTTNNILNGHSLSFGQMIALAQDHLDALLAIQLNTQRSADNSDVMVVSLGSIAKNTASSAGTELRAAGFYGY